MTKEYKIDIRIKNNLIYQRIMEMGYKSILTFCENYKLTYGKLIDLINMKISPQTKKFEWISIVKKLSEIFNCDPEDIITDEQRGIINNKKIEIYANSKELALLTNNNEKVASLEYFEDELDKEVMGKKINEVLETLTPREAEILHMRFGINMDKDHTFEEISKKFDVTIECVRQIQLKALRKLRHPIRSDKLKSLSEYDADDLAVKREFNFYTNHKKEFIKKYNGKFIILKNHKILFVADSMSKAQDWLIEQRGNWFGAKNFNYNDYENVLVQHVTND